MKIQRSTKGFTLVEIMIVVVVIGLLAAMAIPAFQKVRRQSFAKAMANDARQIGSAFQQAMMAAPAAGTGAVNGNVNITYNADSGTLECGISDPATNTDWLTQIVSKIGTGYTISAYNTDATLNAMAFTISHPRVAPSDVHASQATTIGADVNFDAEGKAVTE